MKTTLSWTTPGSASPKSTGVPAWQFFNKPVGGGKIAVLLMNHAATSATLTLPLAQVPGLGSSKASARDIWAHADLGTITNSYTVTLNSHASAFLVLTPQ